MNIEDGLYRGKKLEDMSKEELIKAMNELDGYYRRRIQDLKRN